MHVPVAHVLLRPSTVYTGAVAQARTSPAAAALQIVPAKVREMLTTVFTSDPDQHT